MKIFLDDNRHPGVDSDFVLVETYQECIELVSAFRNIIDFISLDYSLGPGETGYDVLVYMVENKIKPGGINIHSDHQLGVPKMLKYAEANFPYLNVITTNRV